MRFFRLAPALVWIAACKARAPSNPQPVRSDSSAIVVSRVDSAQSAPESTAASQASSSTASSTVDLTRERTLIDEAETAQKSSDDAKARAKTAEAVTSLLGRPEAEQDAAWLELLNSAGRTAWNAQDPQTAQAAWQRLFDIRSRTLPDDHPYLQEARGNLAITMYSGGDFQAARALEVKVLEVDSRTLPNDHPNLQVARGNLANTLYALGDFQGARALLVNVVDVDSRTLPDDHPSLQAARGNLVNTLYALGDFQGARELLVKVVDVYSRTLPGDDPNLQSAKQSLANTLYSLGDFQGARELLVNVVDVYSRTLPADDPNLQLAKQSLASTLYSLGDFQGARAIDEEVVEVDSRTLPADHPSLQAARVNLANALYSLGDLQGARVLDEQVLDVYSRTLPGDDPNLQVAKQNLANTLYSLGDLQGARAIGEEVVEVDSRTLPDDHPILQAARESFGAVLQSLGHLGEARTVYEKVLAIRSAKLPEDDPRLQMTRENLANTLEALGDLQGAKALQQKVLEVYSRTVPEYHVDLNHTRLNLASTLMALGDLQGARSLEEKVLEVYSRTLADDHHDFQGARQMLLATIASEEACAGGSQEEIGGTAAERKQRFGEIALAYMRALRHANAAAIADGSSREAEERISSHVEDLGLALSYAEGCGVFDSDPILEEQAFLLSETARGAAIASAELSRRARTGSGYEILRSLVREASTELARLAQDGPSAGKLAVAREKVDATERDLVHFAKSSSSSDALDLDADLATIAAGLGEAEALIGYRRYPRRAYERGGGIEPKCTDSLCAFVLRSGDRLERVELGPIEPIEGAVDRWCEALGVGRGRGIGVASAQTRNDDDLQTRGRVVRHLIFDPLLPALVGTERVVVALDDALHLVPLDALPLDGDSRVAQRVPGAGFLGDCWRIETRSVLSELLWHRAPVPQENAVLAIGGASFDLAPLPFSADEISAQADEHPALPQISPLLRGGAWESGFEPLEQTGSEARGIAALYREAFAKERPALVLDKRKASRASLAELAPKARFLHIATHGWFAPESVRSTDDPEPLDAQMAFGARTSGEERVKGMSPMLLCGLALAGANLPTDAVGRYPGLVTAEEISSWDLANCELAVLSACDTNVGVRHAGQGMASLQKALQMAGARSVITSLWKVPDEATKDLMLDFYRRLWVERKPKWQSLWEAKMKIRNAKDEAGRSKYTTRDWAAWVLTGDPN